MKKKPVPSGLKISAVILIILYRWTVISITAGIRLWNGKNRVRIIRKVLKIGGAVLEGCALAAEIVLLFGLKLCKITILSRYRDEILSVC